MTSKERLQRTLRGEPVDRPPVSFYELDGWNQDPGNPDPYNVYNDPSWKPLLDLAAQRTDMMVNVGTPWRNAPPNPRPELWHWETQEVGDTRFTTLTVRAGSRTLTQRSRRDRDVNTVWTVEHLLKDADDLRAWLELPVAPFGGEADVQRIVDLEAKLGERGIVYLDTGDPICWLASMFEMGQYTVMGLTEPELMHRALEHCLAQMLPRITAVAQALPGRLWRIYGPEYASPPYLPPYRFEEYVVRYDRPIVEAIQKPGGYARIHSHGRLRQILPHIVATGCAGLDPIEPPPQGDVELEYVRREYGRQLVLFGNLEISDIENLPTPAFRQKVERALREGTAGSGRGFVLMPSACPYGRKLAPLTLRNYETMVECVEACGR